MWTGSGASSSNYKKMKWCFTFEMSNAWSSCVMKVCMVHGLTLTKLLLPINRLAATIVLLRITATAISKELIFDKPNLFFRGLVHYVSYFSE